MAKQISLGPVFSSEWLCVSRRLPWYVARSVFVAGVLGVLSLIWWVRVGSRAEPSVHAQAAAGRSFWAAITATQLAMVLLAAPAATAGAICLDRARGTLAHVLVTDLTSIEIVVGKLAARVVPVLGILLCMVPILAIQSLLGGIDLNAVAGALLVTLGVALCGSSAALFLSTWGTKVHEVLLATYAAWALYLVAVPMWWGYLGVFGRGLAPPGWFLKANPLWMVAAPYLWPNAVNLWDFAAYLAISVIVSAALASVGAARLRPIAARDPGQPRRGARPREGSRILAQLLSLVPGPSLDANPVLWREWHRRRPSRWAGVVWSLYGVMTFGLTATLIALNLSGTPDRLQVASVGNGFQAGIGLLLLSVSAATALAEERVRGNLDALLVTPLATRSIVWGKWCGAYRGVPIVAICPGVLAAVLARQSGRWEGVLWIVGLFLAYGAAVTSLGLALATWIRRVDLAVALNVSVLGGVTVGWLFLVVFAAPERTATGLAAGSPIIGITFPTMAMRFFQPHEWAALRPWWIAWMAIYVSIAAALFWAALITFDGCVGRMLDTPRSKASTRPQSRGELPAFDSQPTTTIA